jgi:hypothetical protein
MTRNVTVEAHVVMDFPKETEIITSPHYTLRYSASDETQSVEVSIDGSAWQECRKAGQYFWFDWKEYETGRYKIAARAKLLNGEIEETDSRRVRVDLEMNSK